MTETPPSEEQIVGEPESSKKGSDNSQIEHASQQTDSSSQPPKKESDQEPSKPPVMTPPDQEPEQGPSKEIQLEPTVEKPVFGDDFKDAMAPFNPRNPLCFLVVEAAGEHLGRLIVELRADVVPKTAENFRLLCTGERGYGYKNCVFHRIVRRFICQSGDFRTPAGKRGGCSAYEEKTFDDENFSLTHSEPGLLSMANAGANRNGSQFFITLVKAPYLDHKHVVFGKVIQGMQALKALAEFGTLSGVPKVPAIIVDCGAF